MCITLGHSIDTFAWYLFVKSVASSSHESFQRWLVPLREEKVTPNSFCLLFLHCLTGLPAVPLSCGIHPGSDQYRVSKGNGAGADPGMPTIWVRYLGCAWVVDLTSLCPALWDWAGSTTFGPSVFSMGLSHCWPPCQLEGVSLSASHKIWTHVSAHVCGQFLALRWRYITELGLRHQWKVEHDLWQLKATSGQTKASKYQSTPSKIPSGYLIPWIILDLCLLCFSYSHNWV